MNSASEMVGSSRAVWQRIQSTCCLEARRLQTQARVLPNEALEELLGACAGAYMDTPAPSTARPYDQRLLSLPPEGATPRPLADFLGSESRALLEGHRLGLLRPRATVMAERRETGLPGLYLDERLRSERREYIQFVDRCLHNGVLRLGKRCRERCGAFFVAKKMAHCG